MVFRFDFKGTEPVPLIFPLSWDHFPGNNRKHRGHFPQVRGEFPHYGETIRYTGRPLNSILH